MLNDKKLKVGILSTLYQYDPEKLFSSIVCINKICKHIEVYTFLSVPNIDLFPHSNKLGILPTNGVSTIIIETGTSTIGNAKNMLKKSAEKLSMDYIIYVDSDDYFLDTILFDRMNKSATRFITANMHCGNRLIHNSFDVFNSFKRSYILDRNELRYMSSVNRLYPLKYVKGVDFPDINKAEDYLWTEALSLHIIKLSDYNLLEFESLDSYCSMEISLNINGAGRSKIKNDYEKVANYCSRYGIPNSLYLKECL